MAKRSQIRRGNAGRRQQANQQHFSQIGNLAGFAAGWRSLDSCGKRRERFARHCGRGKSKNRGQNPSRGTSGRIRFGKPFCIRAFGVVRNGAGRRCVFRQNPRQRRRRKNSRQPIRLARASARCAQSNRRSFETAGIIPFGRIPARQSLSKNQSPSGKRRRACTASANPRNITSVSSQPAQPSVMLCPKTNSRPGSHSWRPATRWLSIIAPMTR